MGKPSRIAITKKSGIEEPFDTEKAYISLMNTGASPEVAREVIKLIIPDIKPGMSTRKIYRMAKKHLRRMDRPSGMRYCIKDAIYALGPTGYPFERFIAKLFETLGYTTQTGQIVMGHCVSHEVDVIATRGNEKLMMECKFHHNGKTSSDVKIALYVESRFRDIAKAIKRNNAWKGRFTGTLVTNTRLTSEAIKYSNCAGLKVIAWKYPHMNGLEHLIEKTGAYPVTVLPAASRATLHALIQKGIVLATDITSISTKALSNITGLDIKASERLKTQAETINKPACMS